MEKFTYEQTVLRRKMSKSNYLCMGSHDYSSDIKGEVGIKNIGRTS